jgi:hypothetical protein
VSEKKGCWDVQQVLGDQVETFATDVKGWDRALDRILEEPGITLEALNTEPKKPAAPKAEAKKQDPPKVEAEEPGVNERRSGATGRAPRKTRGPGETIHTRRSRTQKVG